MILELFLRHYIDPNPRETALAMERLRLAQRALLDVAKIVRQAGGQLKGAPQTPPGAGAAPAASWTREQPTMLLRFHDGVLQQKWIVNEMQGNTATSKRDEWRDVPRDEGEQEHRSAS